MPDQDKPLKQAWPLLYEKLIEIKATLRQIFTQAVNKKSWQEFNIQWARFELLNELLQEMNQQGIGVLSNSIDQIRHEIDDLIKSDSNPFIDLLGLEDRPSRLQVLERKSLRQKIGV